MNVLVDTNVLLSAALRDRLPERVVLFVATEDDCRWLVTPDIMREYVEVLRRPKFAFPAEVIERWVELLDLRTINIGGPPTLPDFPRDPKDAPFLAAALFCDADYLITGDKDLFESKDSYGIPAVTVAEIADAFEIT